MAQWLSWLERRPVTAEVEGSSPFWVVRFSERKIEYGILAQLGEHLPYKQRVTGSSPVGPIYTEKCRTFLDSSMVEHTAVNRGVVGSSPTRGVKAPWSSG